MAGDLVSIEGGMNKILSQREAGDVLQSRTESVLNVGRPFSSDGSDGTAVGPNQNNMTHVNVTRFEGENSDSNSNNHKKISELKELQPQPRLPLVSTSRSNNIGSSKPQLPRIMRLTQREKVRRIAYFEGANDTRFFQAPSFVKEMKNPIQYEGVQSKTKVKQVKVQSGTLGLNMMRLR